MRPLFLSMLTAVAIVSCGSRLLTAEQAKVIADEFVKSEFHVHDPGRLNASISDLSDKWQITYSAPDQMIGGPLIVQIDKRSGKAVLTSGGQ